MKVGCKNYKEPGGNLLPFSRLPAFPYPGECLDVHELVWRLSSEATLDTLFSFFPVFKILTTVFPKL